MESLRAAWDRTDVLGRLRTPIRTAVGAAAGLGGLYFWGSDAGLRDQLIFFAVTAAFGFGVSILGSFAWNLAAEPHRELRRDLDALSSKLDGIEDTIAATRQSHDPIRVALFAVRSELDACSLRISEALDRQAWWNPAQDPRPAGKWDEHFAELSDPTVAKIRPKIETAYQRCDRLNHRIRGYINEHDQSSVWLAPPSVYRFRDNDEAMLKGAQDAIAEARTGVALFLGLDELRGA